MANHIAKHDRLVFDIEGDNFLPGVTTIWCVSAADADHDVTYHWGPDKLGDAVATLRAARCLVGHNIIQYDLRAIWKVLGFWDTCPDLVDTLVTSRFLHQERAGGHGLEAWGKRLGFPKGDFKDFSKYSEEMGRYCDQDVALNKLVLKELEKEHGATLTGFTIFDQRTLHRASRSTNH